MKIRFIAFLFLISIAGNVLADEGMWLPSLIERLNINLMHQKGCRLSAEEIYSINNSSLKDAIVSLDHGSCSGALISEEGLLLTNHHCGFGEIQSHSSVEHDYLKDGFWAMSREEELPNPDKSVSFLIRIEDVTKRFTDNLSDKMTEEEREKKVVEISDSIVNETIKDTHYEATVKDFFDANNYFLFVYETFKDVRLVGAPPSSIGKFGGDTDNWMWPRHTGDFSLFRIYCGPDGKPAEFSENNIPYHPKHYLPVSLRDFDESDFSMILGYPGSTNRYMTSYGVKYEMEVTNPTRVKVRTKKLEILKEYMNTSDKARIQYASKYARSSNYWKYSIGQNKGLERLNVVAKKEALENEFLQWVESDSSRQAKYGEALPLIAKNYEDNLEAKRARQYIRETMLAGPELFYFAYRTSVFGKLLENHDMEDEMIRSLIKRMEDKTDDFYDDFNAGTDLKVASALTSMYFNDVPSRFYPTFFENVQKKTNRDFNKYLKKAYSKSFFSNEADFREFLRHPDLKKLQKDPIYQAGCSVFETYEKITREIDRNSYYFKKGRRLYLAGLMEMQKDQNFYPDANSTLRLTYGNVKSYQPRDAVKYLYYTTIEGYLEKEDPDNPEFYVPKRMKELITAKNWGQYANEEGTIPTCFITNNDITGGNSGSPVINASGELIGAAFDGNWEAMSGDIAFEDELQRCICVDARFILWIIDIYAGATHLIDEMSIVN